MTTVANTSTLSAAGISVEILLRMYRQMLAIRLFEERVNNLYTRALMPGLAHLYIGEEAMAVGVCEALRQDDYITSTHRGHGHSANGPDHLDFENRFPLPSCPLYVVHEKVPSLAAVRDVKGLVRFEDGVDEEPESAAGLEHRAVTRVLLEVRALTLTARPETDAAAVRIRKEADLHGRLC